MKNGRETEVRTDVKIPKSEKMSGLNNKDSMGKKIREHKGNYSKSLRMR